MDVENLWVDDDLWEAAACAVTVNAENKQYELIEGRDDHTIPRPWIDHRYFRKVQAPKIGREWAVTAIESTDEVSGYHAIALQLAVGLQYALLRENRENRMEKAAKKLCQDTCIDYHKMMGREEMAIIDSFIKPQYQLICINAQDINNLIFRGSPAREELFIERNNNHYNVITSTIRCYMQSDFCIPCWKRTDYRRPHRCPGSCERCYDEDPCIASEDRVLCQECNRIFYSMSCYQKHKGNVCYQVRRCSTCSKEYLVANGHKKCIL